MSDALWDKGYQQGLIDAKSEATQELHNVTATADALAAAAARVCAEYDGVHRLRAELSKWFDIRAGIHAPSRKKTSARELIERYSEINQQRRDILGTEEGRS